MTVVTVTQGPNDTAHLRLSRYDEAVIAVIKRMPGRIYDKRTGKWSMPADASLMDSLSQQLKPWDARLDVESVFASRMAAQRTAIADAAAIVKRNDATIDDYDFVTEPYAHQRAGLAFLQRLGSGGLLWEMGLGKTKTAIDYAEWLLVRSPNAYRGGFAVLVICPNTVKDNWGREIALHAGHDDFIIPTGTLDKRARQVATKLYTIVNVESLSSGTFAKALMARTWDLVIVDESTRFKSNKAQRTKNLLKIRAERRVIMTGTPMTNTPEDLWSQLHFVKPGHMGSWWSYRERYLSLDYFKNVTGVKAGMEDELAGKVGQITYRRLKSEVLDLPEKVYMDRVVEMSDTQRRAYQSMKDDMLMLLESGDQVIALSILSQLLRLTQITAGLIGAGDTYLWDDTNPKLLELDWLLRDELRGRPVVVFGLYQRELEELAARYVGGGREDTGIIYGPTPVPERTRFIEEFQAGKRRLLFVQTKTGGIGINLTRAQNAIYYTRGWSLEDYLQSQDRLHRIGQTGTVTIIHLVTKGTIDEEIAKALAGKQGLADRLTGDAARRLAARLLKGAP